MTDPIRKIRYLTRPKFNDHISGIDIQGVFILKAKDSTQRAQLEKEIQEYSAELAKTPFNELDRLYEVTYAAAQKKEEEEQKRLLEQQALETKRILAQPQWQLRCKYWAMMARWDIEEAIAIAAGFDPQIMEESSFPLYVKAFIAKKVREIKEPVIRAWKNHYIAPAKFLLWMEQHNLDFPKEFGDLVTAHSKAVDWKAAHAALKKDYDALEARYEEYSAKTSEELIKRGKQIRDLQGINGLLETRLKELGNTAKPASKEKALNPKERESLLKLVIAMAVDGYGYVPGASKSPIPKQIADILG